MPFKEKRSAMGNLSDSDDEPSELPNKRQKSFDYHAQNQIKSEFYDTSESLLNTFQNDRPKNDSLDAPKSSFAAKLMVFYSYLVKLIQK